MKQKLLKSLCFVMLLIFAFTGCPSYCAVSKIRKQMKLPFHLATEQETFRIWNNMEASAEQQTNPWCSLCGHFIPSGWLLCMYACVCAHTHVCVCENQCWHLAGHEQLITFHVVPGLCWFHRLFYPTFSVSFLCGSVDAYISSKCRSQVIKHTFHWKYSTSSKK